MGRKRSQPSTIKCVYLKKICNILKSSSSHFSQVRNERWPSNIKTVWNTVAVIRAPCQHMGQTQCSSIDLSKSTTAALCVCECVIPQLTNNQVVRSPLEPQILPGEFFHSQRHFRLISRFKDYYSPEYQIYVCACACMRSPLSWLTSFSADSRTHTLSQRFEFELILSEGESPRKRNVPSLPQTLPPDSFFSFCASRSGLIWPAWSAGKRAPWYRDPQCRSPARCVRDQTSLAGYVPLQSPIGGYFQPPSVQKAGITRFKDKALRESAARQLPTGVAYLSSPGSSLALLLGRKSGATEVLPRRFLECLDGLKFSLSSLASSSSLSLVGSVVQGSDWGSTCCAGSVCSDGLEPVSMGSSGAWCAPLFPSFSREEW